MAHVALVLGISALAFQPLEEDLRPKQKPHKMMNRAQFTTNLLITSRIYHCWNQG